MVIPRPTNPPSATCWPAAGATTTATATQRARTRPTSKSRTWELGAHAPGCGCESCETVRVIVRKAGNFALGKAKVHVYLGTWELGAHVPGCDCEPCETIRVVVRKVVGAPQELVLLESHIEDREVVCEGCTCWCHGIEP